MPANRNVVQASRTTTPRAPDSARRLLRRSLLTLSVVALVLVAVVPRVVVLVAVEVNAVEDHGHALRMTRLQRLEGPLAVGAARHFRSNHKHHARHPPADDDRIADPQPLPRCAEDPAQR